LGELRPLVAHLDDLWKAKEAAGVVDLTLRERELGGGRRGLTSVGVDCSVMEDSELLLGNRLVADLGVG